jgi:hypothetical protein
MAGPSPPGDPGAVGAQRTQGDNGGRRRHLRPVDPGPGGVPRQPTGWLAGSEEFLVDCEDGTPFGVVDSVVRDGGGHVIALLVAVGGLVRRRVTSVTPDEIVEIRPVERRIVVSRQGDRRRRRWRRGR